MGLKTIEQNRTFRLLLAVIVLQSHLTLAGEVLYNGIVLPSQWPPDIGKCSQEPMCVPYLLSLPKVVPIDVGRQLFVDDFLIEQTTLKRTFYRATLHPASPVLVPEKPWEFEQWRQKDPPTAMPFSDGVWYDQRDKIFKMWYMGGYVYATCYATSRDGIVWQKPELDVVKGTNIVQTDRRDSSTVWIDYNAKDPDQRFLLDKYNMDIERHVLHCSADGIHWSEIVAEAGSSGDRCTFFYNPFRRKWVFGINSSPWEGVRRRRYVEGDTLAEALQSWPFSKDDLLTTTPAWVGADRLDIRRHPDFDPQLYNLDAVGYESLLVGLFCILRENAGQGDDPARQKINNICVGFSRDGFHWDRPFREPIIDVSEDPNAWNYANVQSVGGCFLVVGDKLYIYASGRQVSDIRMRKGFCSTGLATLRRDGFASMDAGDQEGVLTTRLVCYKGRYLFVNVDAPAGRLQAEVLDSDGQVIQPFSRDNCAAVTVNSTCKQVRWKSAEAGDLSQLAGKPVRFRFYLTKGNLFSFWVSPDKSGASYGYVAAGGPGFTGPMDTVGSLANE